MKIKLSKALWQYIGYKAGWKTSIARKIFAQDKLFTRTMFRTASWADVEQVVANSVDTSGYGSNYILRDNYDEIDASTAKQRIINAFKVIYERDNNFSAQIQAYVGAHRKFSLGVNVIVDNGVKYLAPTFNNMALMHLKSVFTASLGSAVDLAQGAINFAVGDRNLRGVKDIRDVVKMINRAGFIAKNATVKIGTIGSRSTNWDTSYNLHIGGASVPDLLGALTYFTSIGNEDPGNKEAVNHYSLTMGKEIGPLMHSLGLGSIFRNTVEAIKKFEFTHGLKQIWEHYKKVPDYKNATKIATIDLSQHVDEIFQHLMGRITKDFSKLFIEKKIANPQDLLSAAFSMGFSDGDMIDDPDADTIIQASVTQ